MRGTVQGTSCVFTSGIRIRHMNNGRLDWKVLNTGTMYLLILAVIILIMELEAIISYVILDTKEVKCREVKELTQDHTAKRGGAVI